MSGWKEIERLQADFQRAQSSTTVQKLSERNCIEILIKLQEMRLLDVIHTIDGKEYLTLQQLAQEIRDELYVHGGRISLVELQSALNIDYSHIESKVNEIVSSSKSLHLVLGQLIDKSYIDQTAEEINETLQSLGQVTIADLCKTYDLPGEFLIPEIVSRLGTIISGRLDETNKDAIFTDSFIAQHKARIRGILTAVTRPTSLNPILSGCKISSKLFFSLVDELIAEKRIRGQVVGGRSDKSTFLPSIYVQTQNQWVDSFFQQNGYLDRRWDSEYGTIIEKIFNVFCHVPRVDNKSYHSICNDIWLEYETLSRLDINDPTSYAKRRFKDVLPLSTVCVGSTIIDLISATVDETLASKGWIDISPLLPSPFTDQDCSQLLQYVLYEGGGRAAKERKGLVVDTVIASMLFVESCKPFFSTIMNDRAQKEAKNAAVLALTEEEMKLYGDQTENEGKRNFDKKDERRKKATAGSGSTKRGETTSGGAGIGAREVKTKGKDKKRLKKQREFEAELEKKNEKKQSLLSGARKFMDVEEIAEVLRDNLPDCPEELLRSIADEIHRPLNTSYEELSKSVFQHAMLQKHKQGEQKHDKVLHEVSHKKSRKHFEEEINTIWCNVHMFSESLKNFDDELSSTLQRHLLRSVCDDLVNVLYQMLEYEYLPGQEEHGKLGTERRLKILSKLPQEFHTPMKQLNQAINGKSLDDFNVALDEALAPTICDVMLKKLDKKRERQLLHGHKMSLLQQLQESEPAKALHLTVVIIFQTLTGQMLHAPGKCIPSIIAYLREHVTVEAYLRLFTFQGMVMELLTSDDKDNVNEITVKMETELPNLRQLATSIKKKG